MWASVAQSDVDPTGDQEVLDSITAGFGNILSLRLIIKYICMVILLRLIQEGQCQFLVKEYAQNWLIAQRTKPAQEKCA